MASGLHATIAAHETRRRHARPPETPPPRSALRHSLAEDALALLSGTALIALAVALFQHAHLLSGGTAGLAFWLQETRGWRAGHVQMAVDTLILLLALITAPLTQVALSVVGAVVLNLTLAINHRAGRYIAN